MRKEITNSLIKKVLKAYIELKNAQSFINDLSSVLKKYIDNPELDVIDEVALKALTMPRFDIFKNEAMRLKSHIKNFCEKKTSATEASAFVSATEALAFVNKLSSEIEEALSLFSVEKIVNFLKS